MDWVFWPYLLGGTKCGKSVQRQKMNMAGVYTKGMVCGQSAVTVTSQVGKISFWYIALALF